MNPLYTLNTGTQALWTIVFIYRNNMIDRRFLFTLDYAKPIAPYYSFVGFSHVLPSLFLHVPPNNHSVVFRKDWLFQSQHLSHDVSHDFTINVLQLDSRVAEKRMVDGGIPFSYALTHSIARKPIAKHNSVELAISLTPFQSFLIVVHHFLSNLYIRLLEVASVDAHHESMFVQVTQGIIRWFVVFLPVRFQGIVVNTQIRKVSPVGIIHPSHLCSDKLFD